MSYKKYFKNISIFIISIVIFSGCGGGTSNNDNGGSAPSIGIWSLPANSTLTDAQITKFNSGELYYNVHSSAYPNGEIRGQLDSVKAVFSTSSNISAILTGSKEVPGVTTSANGYGIVFIDPASKKMSGSVITSGITGTSAHIHNAAAGIDGPILITLTGGPTVWLIPDDTILSDDNLTKLNNGTFYFNVHSAAFPDGEIRGQILSQNVKFAVLKGSNEVPAITTEASGTALLGLETAKKKINGFIKTTGISGISAHIHVGASGLNGGIAVTLTETSSGSGVWMVPENAVLTDAQVTSFNAGELYFNVHSSAHPNGEIRGQITSTGLGATISVKSATLNGSKEVPSVATNATGFGIATLNSDTKEISGYVTTIGITGTVAHIHEGVAGVAGSIAIPMTQIEAGSAGSDSTTTY